MRFRILAACALASLSGVLLLSQAPRPAVGQPATGDEVARFLPSLFGLLFDDAQDDTLPTIRFVSPGQDAQVSTLTPRISVALSDTGSGINRSSFKLFLNGVDVSRAARVTSTSATYDVATPLQGGANFARAEVTDHGGNRAAASVRFEVSSFQAFADCAPASGTTPLTVRHRSRGVFTGGAIETYRWDFDGDGEPDTRDPVARDYSRVYTEPGRYTASLAVTNNFGEETTDTCSWTVLGSAPTATADAAPSNGPAPLEVTLNCTARDVDGEIARYEWDFEGDGVYDYSSGTSGRTSHVYPAQGTFAAQCRVTDDDGLTGLARTGTTTVRPAPTGAPVVTGRASPASGRGPLNVRFSGSARVSGASIVRWEWDFEGDGVYDYVSESSASTQYTYTAGGIYSPRLRATTSDGLTSIDGLEVVVDVQLSLAAIDNSLENRPAGTFGRVTDVIAFTAVASSQFSSRFPPSAAFDGDVNTSWFTELDDAANLGTSPFIGADFAEPVAVSRLGVRGNRAFGDDYSVLRGRFDLLGADDAVLFSREVALPAPERDIEIEFPQITSVRKVRFVSLEDLSNEPGISELEIAGPLAAGGTGTIETTISTELDMHLKLHDEAGAAIRTLFRGRREAGTYQDVWDGLDEAGQRVASGSYFAVLSYEFGGEQRVLDLTTSTGGRRDNPTRTPIPRTFAPLAGEPLQVEFTLDEAHEVTAFMGRFNVDTRLVTFFERLPLGKGKHTVTWNGTNADGVLVHPPLRDQFLFGIFGYDLPDNAILVESQARLRSLAVSPAALNPTAVAGSDGSQAVSEIAFSLDSRSDVELLVLDAATGRPVRRTVYRGLGRGENTVTFDGRHDSGALLAPGRYRLGLAAIDSAGNRSIRQYALLRIFF